MDKNYAIISDGKNFELGIVTGEKKKKITIKLKNSRTKNINENRIIVSFNHDSGIDNVSQELENQAGRADIKTLYELLNENSLYSLEEIAELLFDDKQDFNKAAAYIALKNDNIYFKEKNKGFITAKPDEIETKLEQIKLKEKNLLEKNRIKQDALEWFSKSFPDNKEIPDYVIQFVEPVKNYAIYAEDYRNKFDGKKILKEIKNTIDKRAEIHSDSMGAFNLCVDLGIFNEHENLAIHRFNIINGFKPAELEYAENISKKEIPGKRLDLTELDTYSIDDETTRDIDDAFSIIKTQQGYELYIHIADAAFFIEIDSPLDKVASNLGMSVYLPSGKISMFPPVLSEDKMSLIEGVERPALTFKTVFDEKFDVKHKEIIQSKVLVNKNLSYKEIDKQFESKETLPYFDILKNITEKLRNDRINKNAIEFLNPDFKVGYDGNEISIIKNMPGISSAIIKELMVLCGYQAASFCLVNKIPCVYVSQDEPMELPHFENRIISKIEDIFAVIRKLNKANLMTTPFKHYALGFECYTQCTSPIRRYHDLIIQRQIKAFLNNEKLPYSIEEIQKVSATSEIFKQNLSSAEKEERKYWMLKHLELDENNDIHLTVLNKNRNDYQVYLDDYGLQTKINSHIKIQPGGKLIMKLKSVNPRAGTFSLKHIKNK